jgi:branched-chain amino acid transport system permease protein
MSGPVISRSNTASRIALIAALIVVAGLAAAPWWGTTATMRLITEFMFYLALACMWNLLAGYAGLLSVGQHAYVGLGGYVLFSVVLFLGISPLWALPIAAIVGAVLSLPVAWLVFRLKGPYFAIGTWVVADVFRLAFAQMTSVGGGSGLSLPASAMKSIGSKSEREMIIYFASLAVCLGAVVVIYLLLRSRLGLALTAIRDNETASSSLGINIGRIMLP